MRTSRTTSYFAAAGFVGGAVASAVLWRVTGPEYHPAVLGFRGLIHFYALPVVAAAVAAASAYLLEAIVRKPKVGVGFGLLAAALSFLIFNFLLSVYVTAGFVGGSFTDLLTLFGAYTMFGGVLVGWVLLVVGGFAGWLAHRYASHP